ncbi:Protein MIF2 [Spathaspora sp. JA1]|nr:Protein MIF2 [Spathaspora sp. JA1]
MDIIDIGNRGRKTQLELPKNVSKDEYGMEDIDDFFDSDTSRSYTRTTNRHDNIRQPPSTSTSRKLYQEPPAIRTRKEFTEVARKIDFTNISPAIQMIGPTTKPSSKENTGNSSGGKNKKSPLRSPLHENQDRTALFVSDTDSDRFEQDPAQFDYEPQIYEDEEEDEIIEVPKKHPRTESKAASRMTKNMALGKPNRRKLLPQIETDSDSEENYSFDDSTQSDKLPSPPPTLKKLTRTKPPVKFKITKESPLPSPPPEGLRRSKRTRIKPLQFWRNERVIYSKVEAVGDSTLIQDIRKVPLREIKEIVTIDEVEPVVPARKKPRAKSKSPANKPAQEFLINPDVPGAEWFDDKSLAIKVKDEYGNVKQENIAYTLDGGVEQDAEGDEQDFKVNKLFDINRDFCGTGLIELYPEALKPKKVTGSSIFIFHVIQGIMEVTINTTTFLVTKGCSFQVPNNNEYSIRNIGETTSNLFFMQVRKPITIEQEENEDSWED